jgi:hypothetical protein
MTLDDTSSATHAAAESKDVISAPTYNSKGPVDKDVVPCYDPSTMQLLGHVPAMSPAQVGSVLWGFSKGGVSAALGRCYNIGGIGMQVREIIKKSRAAQKVSDTLWVQPTGCQLVRIRRRHDRVSARPRGCQHTC